MCSTSGCTLQGYREFTNFDTLAEVKVYASLKVSEESRYIEASYTFVHNDKDFVKQCDLVRKRRNTKYEYSSDGLQCKVSVLLQYDSDNITIDDAIKLYQTEMSRGTQPSTQLVELPEYSLCSEMIEHKYKPTSLMDLPNEVVAIILNFSKLDDIKNFAVVCSRVASVVRSELQRRITVSRVGFLKPTDFVGVKFVGVKFVNYTFVNREMFFHNIAYFKKELVKSIHFAYTMPDDTLQDLRDTIEVYFPNTEIIVSGLVGPPVSINPRMSHLHPQFNGNYLLTYTGYSKTTSIAFEDNIIAGEVIIEYFSTIPNLQSFLIDNFVMNEKLVLTEKQKLNLRFLYIMGNTYTDLFGTINMNNLRCLHFEQPNLNQDILSKLEGLEEISIGSIEIEDIDLLNKIPSNTLRYFSIYFPKTIPEDKITETVSHFVESLSITSAPRITKFTNFIQARKRFFVLDSLEDYEFTFNVNIFTRMSTSSEHSYFERRLHPVGHSERILRVFRH